jgi:hypothetical protein
MSEIPDFLKYGYEAVNSYLKKDYKAAALNGIASVASLAVPPIYGLLKITQNIPTKQGSAKGFTDVIISGSRQPLSIFSRVDYLGYDSSTNRENFTILDYPYQGKSASVSAISATQSRFGLINYQLGNVPTLRFSNSKKTLTIDERPGFSLLTGSQADIDDNIPVLLPNTGPYYLILPGKVQTYGQGYIDANLSIFARNWFQIEDDLALKPRKELKIRKNMLEDTYILAGDHWVV